MLNVQYDNRSRLGKLWLYSRSLFSDYQVKVYFSYSLPEDRVTNPAVLFQKISILWPTPTEGILNSRGGGGGGGEEEPSKAKNLKEVCS